MDHFLSSSSIAPNFFLKDSCLCSHTMCPWDTCIQKYVPKSRFELPKFHVKNLRIKRYNKSLKTKLLLSIEGLTWRPAAQKMRKEATQNLLSLTIVFALKLAISPFFSSVRIFFFLFFLLLDASKMGWRIQSSQQLQRPKPKPKPNKSKIATDTVLLYVWLNQKPRVFIWNSKSNFLEFSIVWILDFFVYKLDTRSNTVCQWNLWGFSMIWFLVIFGMTFWNSCLTNIGFVIYSQITQNFSLNTFWFFLGWISW